MLWRCECCVVAGVQPRKVRRILREERQPFGRGVPQVVIVSSAEQSGLKWRNHATPSPFKSIDDVVVEGRIV